MGTKADPGAFDCYAAAHPNEPIFVLRAHDPLAHGLVRQWAEQYAVREGANPEKVQEAHRCADDMLKWARDNMEPEPVQ